MGKLFVLTFCHLCFPLVRQNLIKNEKQKKRQERGDKSWMKRRGNYAIASSSLSSLIKFSGRNLRHVVEFTRSYILFQFE